MNNYTLLGLLLFTACGKSDAQPNFDKLAKAIEKEAETLPKPTAKPAPQPASKPEPKPATKSTLDAFAAFTAKRAADLKLDLNRKFVSITIDPATGKKIKRSFCGDDDMKAWNALPKTLIDRYSARIANTDLDTVRCDKHGDLTFCQISPQDEHEQDLTFAIAHEPWGLVIAGVVERETWMVDPDSAKLKTDLAERDRELALATTDDCFKPESSRGREQSR